MESTLDRIKQYIDYKQLTISSFERAVGLSNGSFASQLKKGKSIGVDKLENILKTFPELSAQWLLTGAGEMVKQIIITKENANQVMNKAYVDNNAPLYLERRMMTKIETELAQGKDDRSTFYRDINTVLNFQYIISNLDRYYFEDIDKKFYEIVSNFDGKNFDIEKYRADIYKEIDKNKSLAPALSNLAKAIKDFYTEVKPADTKGIIDGYFTGI